MKVSLGGFVELIVFLEHGGEQFVQGGFLPHGFLLLFDVLLLLRVESAA